MGSLVKSLMQILVKLNVLHTYQFFLSYYKILDRVQSGNNATITVMRLLYVNILLKGVHFVWLFFRNDHLSTRENLMHYNIMGIEHMPAFFNIFAASLFYLVLQIMLQLMFRNTGISGVIIRGCIVNGTSRFMTSTFQFAPLVVLFFRLFSGHDLDRHKVEKNLQVFVLSVRYVCDSILVIFYIFYYQTFFLFLGKACRLFFPDDLFGLFTFLATFAHLTLTVYSMVEIMALLVCLAFLLCLCTGIQLTQMDQYMGRLNAANFTYHRFAYFRREVVLAMQWIGDINRLYGSILFSFILSNMPLNTILAMMLTNWRLTMRQQVVAVFAFSVQSLFLFTVSFFASLMTNKFHRNAKQFIRLSIALMERQQQRGKGSGGKDKINSWGVNNAAVSTKFSLSLSIYIAHFHTTNQYSMNLGRYGKITFALFGRQLFYYLKLVVFAYKIIQSFAK